MAVSEHEKAYLLGNGHRDGRGKVGFACCVPAMKNELMHFSGPIPQATNSTLNS